MPEVLARPPALPLLGAGHEPHLPLFSRPDQTPADAALLGEMLRELAAALSPRSPLSPRSAPAPSADGRRLFLFDTAALRGRGPLAFVGFRGDRRADVTAEVEAAVEALDAALIDQIRAGSLPGVLGYSCWPTGGGNWINLVVLRGLAEIAGWHRQALHRQASAQWSSRYYASVRIHNGTLPEGVRGALSVTSTKYFDFCSQPFWAAQRTFERAGTG